MIKMKIIFILMTFFIISPNTHSAAKLTTAITKCLLSKSSLYERAIHHTTQKIISNAPKIPITDKILKTIKTYGAVIQSIYEMIASLITINGMTIKSLMSDMNQLLFNAMIISVYCKI